MLASPLPPPFTGVLPSLFVGPLPPLLGCSIYPLFVSPLFYLLVSALPPISAEPQITLLLIHCLHCLLFHYYTMLTGPPPALRFASQFQLCAGPLPQLFIVLFPMVFVD